MAATIADVAFRAWQPAVEFSLLLGDPVYWGWGVPRGDGHAVLVLPGLFAGDDYLGPLRLWLRRVGYTPVLAGLDRNPGWSPNLVQQLGLRAEAACARTGRPISIVGHSMGGILGRSIAARRPHTTGHVIALGSPLVLVQGDRLALVEPQPAAHTSTR
ncbi:MAG: esterase/lipase family protein [Candidatus Rokuibacteriota bacterium]